MYYLFAGEIYYAEGGILDYRGSFDSVDAAEKKAKALIEDENLISEWWHIVDASTMKIVMQYRDH